MVCMELMLVKNGIFLAQFSDIQSHLTVIRCSFDVIYDIFT